MEARYEVINFREENTVINAPHGIILFLPNGNQIELKYRRSDGEVSLSTSNGRLMILPVASNVVRVEVY